MLSNAYFLAKFRFDTAENEPAKNLQNFKFSKNAFSKNAFSKNVFSKNAFSKKPHADNRISEVGWVPDGSVQPRAAREGGVSSVKINRKI